MTTPPIDALFLGSVLSNGGDLAIFEAQLDVLNLTHDSERVAIQDSAPLVASRLFPGAVQVVGTSPARSGLRDRLAGLRTRQPAPPRADRPLPGSRTVSLSDAVAAAELVCYCGGTSLIEKYLLAPKFAAIQEAIDADRPVVLMPASLGPFTSPDNQHRMREVCAGARLILLRDERSFRHLADIGADIGRTHVVPDIVFAMAKDDDLDRLRARSPVAEPKVAICARDCSRFFPVGKDAAGQRAYEDALGGFVEWMVRSNGAEVQFVSTCQGIPSYSFDDSRIAARIAGRLPGDVAAHVTVDRDQHTPDQLRRIFAASDLVVSTRMHGAILALGAGTLTLPIAYEFKTHEVFGQLGVGNLVHDIADMSAADLVATAQRLLSPDPVWLDTLATAVDRVARDARAVGGLVRAATSGTAA